MQVADWKIFWAMFNNWIWVFQQLLYLEENNEYLDSEIEEQMQWLQIDSEILAGNVDKVRHKPDNFLPATLSLESGICRVQTIC